MVFVVGDGFFGLCLAWWWRMRSLVLWMGRKSAHLCDVLVEAWFFGLGVF